MAIHIIDEANRCLNCKKPRCMEGCPMSGAYTDPAYYPDVQGAQGHGCGGGAVSE